MLWTWAGKGGVIKIYAHFLIGSSSRSLSKYPGEQESPSWVTGT